MSPRDSAAEWIPRRRAAFIALFALAAGLFVTAVVSQALYFSQRAESHARFDGAVRRLEYDVLRRINQSQYGLRGLAATYASFGDLGTTQFRDWVDARDLPGEFPGVRGFGIIRRVERADLAELIARKQKTDPKFTVNTAGTASDLYVVTDIEPRATNAVAYGYDLGQEPNRRQGLERAVATGHMALTDRVAVRKDGEPRAGWLMILPVFRPGTDPASPEGRKRALAGLLYAPLIAADVLAEVRSTFGPELDFRLYDGPVVEGQMLFDSADDPRQLITTGARGGWEGRKLLTQRLVQLGGQDLTLDIAGRPALESSVVVPASAALLGTLLSALLALLIWQLANGRRKAEEIAAAMTHDLRRAARDLTASEAFLEQAQRIAHIGGWEVDLETLAVRLSAQMLFLFDLPHDATPTIEEFIGFFEPKSQEMIEQATQVAVRDGQSWDLELKLASAKGIVRWVRTVGRVDRQGDRSMRLIGTLQDITDNKQAGEALRASENLMRVITDNMPGRVGYWDRSLHCRFANRYFAETFGRTQEAILGVALLDLLGPERYEAIRVDVEAALSGQTRAFEREEQWREGMTQAMLVHYIPDIRDGEVQGFFVLALDVTELKDAREAARQASAAKGQFLANTSHELRTPMNAVIGMLTLLGQTELSPRQADYVSKAEGAARSLLALLNDILDFSKIEAGKLALDPRPFKLESLLRDLSVILAANLRSENVEILFDIDASLPYVLVGDDMRLRQVLINLGGNAVKFTDRGEVVVGARLVSREGSRARIEFSVSDTGIGIAQEQQARIFEGFSQAEASTVRKYGGTGLGLAISQRLVTLMGSTLQLESEPGRGSRFYFALDLVLGPGAAGEHAAHAEPARVLFVDDNPVAIGIFKEQAASLHWTADTATSAEEAVEKVRTAPATYDAIFIDWRMPKIDGVEAAMMMRRLPHLGQSAILIMVSAQARARFAELSEAQRAMLDGYLVKPVTASMLRDAVSEATFHVPQFAPTERPEDDALSGLRLLLVEDNKNNQQVARELLASHGAIVDIADDGQQGVERVTASPSLYDLVLMDVQMPVMDGFTATRELRMAGLTLPIIAMTANAMSGDREACLEAGMDDHVGKPFDLDALVKTILQHVGRSRETRGTREFRAPSAQASASSPAGDFEAAVQRLGGDIGFYRQLYPAVKADTEAMFAKLGPLIAQGERGEAGRLFHTIKGLAATIGAMAFSRAAAQAEKAMTRPAISDEEDSMLLESAMSAYESACVELDSLLAAHDESRSLG